MSNKIDPQSLKTEAMDALRHQLNVLAIARERGPGSAAFKRWHLMTLEILKHYMGGTRYRLAFINLVFVNNNSYTYADPDQTFYFACDDARAILETAIEHIERLGLPAAVEATQQAAPVAASDRSINFHAPVTIGGISTGDHAVQHVDQTVNLKIAALDSIKQLLQSSEELGRREIRESGEAISALTTELQKPENKRDWKDIVTWSNLILDAAKKAKDLTGGLAVHLPWVVEIAKHAAQHIVG